MNDKLVGLLGNEMREVFEACRRYDWKMKDAFNLNLFVHTLIRLVE